MNSERFEIDGHIPAVLYGDASERAFLFVHGQSGCKEEAERFARIAQPAGWQVLAVDLPEHGERRDGTHLVPWEAVPELQTVFAQMKKKWRRTALYAISIGAWMSMLALKGEAPEKCLLVSPVADMTALIESMMQWAGVTEERLRREGEIPTNFGQTLSWKYLCWARENPAGAPCREMRVLYGENDHLVPRGVIEKFAAENRCALTVMQGGEHWFHTEEELAFLQQWERESL